MYNVKFNSSSANYLSNYDLASKYNLKSNYCCPKIHKVKLQVSLKNFLIASNFQNKNDFNSNIQLKSFLAFYLIFSVVPFVNFYSFKSSKFSKIKDGGDFLIELTLSDKQMIDNLLFNLWLDNKTVFSFSKNFGSLNLEEKTKNWSYNTKISGSSFNNLEDYFSNVSKDIDLNKLQMNLSLNFTNFKGKKNLLRLVKNILNNH